ncbi:hypothetical protein H5P28_10955 [Ruficoccus amylovorans]|uniref:Uncharacterized protein n=1 Tax=Ruficoccus amylovorans TaxID=1804625 RepID=A0A842HEX8_9BACT|nr:hypothetical protein [Ruficoccus amylovorans]MBC2594780.1 hypothetical protein [Ruficoccus amylovorans]
MKIDLSRLPAPIMETVRLFAAVEGVVLQTQEDYSRYILEDKDALEVALPYLDSDYTWHPQ